MQTTNVDIVIDPEFRSLIPPLTAEEKEQLEVNLVADGCRERLVVWAMEPAAEEEAECKCKQPKWTRDIFEEVEPEYRDGNEDWRCEKCGQWCFDYRLVLVDGHNRFEICREKNIAYEIQERTFTDREEAIDWIIDNQLGRRNLSPEKMSWLRGTKYNRAKRKHGGDRKSSRQNGDLKTRQKVAKETEPFRPKMFFVIGEESPWRMIELNVETGERGDEHWVQKGEWFQIWRAVGLSKLRSQLDRWLASAA